jgi:hypothetical protein
MPKTALGLFERGQLILLVAATVLAPALLMAQERPHYADARTYPRTAGLRVNWTFGRFGSRISHLSADDELDAAVREIDRAGVVDRKQVVDRPAVKGNMEDVDRFRSIVELLRAGRNELQKEANNPHAEWESATEKHITAALESVHKAPSTHILIARSEIFNLRLEAQTSIVDTRAEGINWRSFVIIREEDKVTMKRIFAACIILGALRCRSVPPRRTGITIAKSAFAARDGDRTFSWMWGPIWNIPGVPSSRRSGAHEEELTKMQTDLDRGRWDNGVLNDVIDSIRKSSSDNRLAERDRAVLADDLGRLKDFRDQYNRGR